MCVCVSGKECGGCQGSEGREGQRDPKCCGDDDRSSGQPAEKQTHHPHG